MAGIHALSFPVTLLAASASFCTSTSQINTKLCKVVALTDVLSICPNSHRCKSGTHRPVLHDVLKLLHVTKIFDTNHILPPHLSWLRHFVILYKLVYHFWWFFTILINVPYVHIFLSSQVHPGYDARTC